MAFSLRLPAAALVVSALLAACGGGDGADTTPKTVAVSVKVMGDSLSDSGTFGYKFTVQGTDASTGKPFQVWTERIANLYGSDLCPRYTSADKQTLNTFTVNGQCTNYAVGGGQINPLNAQYQPVTSPISIVRQIQDAGAAGVSANDLVLINGGANDVAALITAFLGAATTGQNTPLLGLLGSKVDAVTLQGLLAQGQSGTAQAGGLYLQILAKTLVGTAQTELLARGVTRVAVLNVPALTLTPRFTAVIKQIEQSLGAQTAQQMNTLFDGWVQTFNAALVTAAQGDKRLAVVDFYTEFKGQVQNPAQYKFTNVTVPACALAGVSDDRLDLCTSTVLSARIPPGESSPDWWQSYAFANGFHPTPYGYQQMSQLVSRTLAQAGWL